MNGRPCISPFAERLIHLAAGPQMANAIIGDLEENVSTRPRSQIWVWKQVIGSLDSLLLMQVRSIPGRDWGLHITALFAAFIAIGLWEQGVARNVSWPIAQELLGVSPLGAGNTCRAVYVMVYGGFVLSLMAVFSGSAKIWRRSAHCRIWHVLALGLIASVPAIFLMIRPLSTDGAIWFRFAQLALVWTLVLAVISRARIRNQPRESRSDLERLS